MARIHATAIIDPKACLADDVEVGAYSVIGPEVRIAAGSRIGPHVVIEGRTSLGMHNEIFQFASIGAAPQDKKYADEPTELIIGDHNTIREFCTLNRGTVQDQGITRIGSHNWIMAYVHVAHDCQIGDHCIFANNATLAGHVEIGDWVILGGFTTIHQFCRIGAHAMTAFTAAVSQDVPPYVMAAGNRATPNGINSEGLRRRGFAPEAIMAIKRAYKALYRAGLSREAALLQLEGMVLDCSEIAPMVEFVRASERGIIR